MSSDKLRQRNTAKKEYPRDDRIGVLIRDEPTVIQYERDVDAKGMALAVLGLVALNFILSFFVTGSAFWGSESKLIKPEYIKYMAFERKFGLASPRVFSEEELATYDGSREHPESLYQILLALNGTVYDVSANPATYGPGGPYHIFAGRDAARAFITGCFKDADHLSHDLRGLEPAFVNETIAGWHKFFSGMNKYWSVGTVDHKIDYSKIPDTKEEFNLLKQKGELEEGTQWVEIPKFCENARGQMPGFRETYVHNKPKPFSI